LASDPSVCGLGSFKGLQCVFAALSNVANHKHMLISWMQWPITSV